MSQIAELKQQIEQLMEENRRIRLDAGKHTLLESLKEKLSKLAASLRRKRDKKSRQEPDANPEQPTQEAEEPKPKYGMITIPGPGTITVDKEDEFRVLTSGPYHHHVTKSGDWYPATVTMHEGRAVILPLANVVMNAGPDEVVTQFVADNSFVKANLLNTGEKCLPEKMLTQQEYNERVQCLREARKISKS